MDEEVPIPDTQLSEDSGFKKENDQQTHEENEVVEGKSDVGDSHAEVGAEKEEGSSEDQSNEEKTSAVEEEDQPPVEIVNDEPKAVEEIEEVEPSDNISTNPKEEEPAKPTLSTDNKSQSSKNDVELKDVNWVDPNNKEQDEESESDCVYSSSDSDSKEKSVIKSEDIEDKELEDSTKIEFEEYGEKASRREEKERPIYTEVELEKKRLSESERGRVPCLIRNPLLQFFYGFLYSFLGLYFVIKHGLWRYMIFEFLTSICARSCLCCFFCLCCIPLCCIIESCFSCMTSISTMIMNLLFKNGMYRISYIEEHKMKGVDQYTFGFRAGRKTGRKTPLWLWFVLLFLKILAFAIRFLFRQWASFSLPIFAICVIFGFFPPIGLILLTIFIFYVVILDFGFTAFELGYIYRKKYTFWDAALWCIRHHFLVLGYGLGSLILWNIPIISILSHLFGCVGATRLMMHLQEARRYKKDKKGDNLV